MEIKTFLNKIQGLEEFSDLYRSFDHGKNLPGVGLVRAVRPLVMAAIHAEIKQPILFITDRADRALTIHEEVKFWSGSEACMMFPEPTPLFYEQAAWGNRIRQERINVLTRLSNFHIPGAPRPLIPPIVIAPVRGVMTRTIPRRDFLKFSKVIETGKKISLQDLARSFSEVGYEAVDTVVEIGQYAKRGGVLDIWSLADQYPIRLDFFGDEIESIRTFNPATQRTYEPREKVQISPASEIRKTNDIAAELVQNDWDEFYIPIAYRIPSTILDYLPSNALVVIDDLGNIDAFTQEIEEKAVQLRSESIAEGLLPAEFPIPYLSWSEVFDQIRSQKWIGLGRDIAQDDSPIASRFSLCPKFGGNLNLMMDHLLNRCQNGDRVWVVSRQSSRLAELWKDCPPAIDSRTNPPMFLDGSLSEGFIIRGDEKNETVQVLTDSEIFGWERPRQRQARTSTTEAPESMYADLNPGDFVVHIDYGIGKFIGLVYRSLEGADREFLCLEYDGGDQLFVPIYQSDRLTRYVGADGSEPRPTRLGTAEWSQAKQRVKGAVKDVAKELLELYAIRQSARGHAFRVDTPWQFDLEASFPYYETEDQIKAINEVKQDMESLKPMDRLLCGDVGYGKTEVALRAAFKSVMDGKQVALLVPTTVLAQQHFETFRQRLAAFPVIVEMLSRFRSPKEQTQILKGLQNGAIDIVIGTHRLVQPDVIFNDLGLVIIDEEQRFGVTHKEFLKKLRTEVDVLTLTATPIPRTLYMALTGVRDISNINTPPEERLPVITHIGPYSPKLIRQAMLREMERGGQIFFVHNRVQTIYSMNLHLRKLIPDARIGIAHGQMPEAELSRVMHLFTHGEIDVLLCTSIIESGLDIPNANTLIVDRADAFGLSQLYQLRGRVGRGAQRAYAYFFRHRKKRPTIDGWERLEVIAENNQLGSGYSIAMRDLEMRGAGDLLGTRQHGYIEAVGFQLYTKLLANEVRHVRAGMGLKDLKESPLSIDEIRMPVNVDLPIPIGIPKNYVTDNKLRLNLYRRIANLQTAYELDELQDEFIDRFGKLPEETKNIFVQMRIRQLAESAGLASVTIEGEQVVFRYPSLPQGVTKRELPIISSKIRAGKNAYWLPINQTQNLIEEILDALTSIINIPVSFNSYEPARNMASKDN